jgi:hypothetical protein
MPILEKQIQLAICDYLAYKRDVMFWRQNTNPIYDHGKFYAMPKYSKNGVPDIIVIKKGGWFVGLEVKRPGGKQSASQTAFQIECEKMGAEYHVVTSIDDVKNIGL